VPLGFAVFPGALHRPSLRFCRFLAPEFGTRGDDRIGDLKGRLHRGDVVYPHDVRAIQDAGRHGCCGRELLARCVILREKLFAGRANHDRPAERLQFSQSRDQFRILLPPLAEAEPWINHDSLRVHAIPLRPVDGCVEFRRHRACHVLHRRQFGPHIGSAPHVVQDQAGIAVRSRPRQLHVERQSAGVVDDLNAILHCFRCHGGLVGVHRQGHAEMPFEPLQHWNQPAKFLGF